MRGIRIVDLTRMLPGGTATLLLADLGADVVKVEHPTGDDTRYLHPRVGADSSVQHQYLDRGKASVRVDLKTAHGRQQVLDLCRDADAVIESFRPGVADRLGIGHADIRAVRPQIVFLSLTGYGQEGPRSRFAGHDLNFMSVAGITEGITPTMPADVAGGMIAALGIVSGVMASRHSGTGVHIDLSLTDAALVLAGQQVAERLGELATGEEIRTPLYGTHPCYQVYRCQDGRLLSLGAIEPKFWVRITELLGRPDWVDRQDDGGLITELTVLFATRPLDHWVELLDGPDTCVTGVATAADLLADPHLSARRSLVQHDTPAGPVWQPAPPLRLVAPAPVTEMSTQSDSTQREAVPSP
ncbi:CoA transferase [Nakamurella sp. YIM 132087]|uniref:CoA transferase n=1 Tax=Nakamurella alba TaxID=2665158 RepID=A0A7K1FH35_9ACTN|nr:CaiB/BaiF CoA-transferase family protein [Nakamurella alba]MTD13432.1 CoA transferase [Nakamurella alba]